MEIVVIIQISLHSILTRKDCVLVRQFQEGRQPKPATLRTLLHNSLNRNRFEKKIMQQFKVLQRPLRV